MASAGKVAQPSRRDAVKSKAPRLTPADWDAWVQHLAHRGNPLPLASLLAVKRCAPLRWALPAEVEGTESERLVLRLERLKPSARSGKIAAELEAWLDELHGRRGDVSLGLEAVAWCHGLPRLARILPAAPWSELLDRLVELAQEAGNRSLEEPLTEQLLAGELPWTLAYFLPEIAACQQLAEGARETLSHGVIELLDGEGLPHGDYLPLARCLLACWTRCGYLAGAMRRSCFKADAKAEFQRFLRQTLRLCRADGSQVLSHDSAGTWSPTLFEAALTLIGDAVDVKIARCILPGSHASTHPGKLPSPAVDSEWAMTAVMRRDWRRTSDQIAVTYNRKQYALELSGGTRTLISGPCQTDIRIDGQSLLLDQDWEEVCWLSDDDVDYLELECQASGGWRVQRQLLLARADRFVFWADALLGPESAAIDYRLQLPLCRAISFAPEQETREGFLWGSRKAALVMPLHLPEWRAERVDGACEPASGGMLLRQHWQGRRMYAPLFIDLEPRRFQRPFTWRKLTVAERLQILPHETAVGYRVHVGYKQWLIYRSLGPVGNRTVLGQNFCSEFVLGRFTRDGETEKLIEIE